MREKSKHGELHHHDMLPIHDGDGPKSDKETHRVELQKAHLESAVAGRPQDEKVDCGTKGHGSGVMENDVPRGVHRFAKEGPKDGHPEVGFVLHHGE